MLILVSIFNPRLRYFILVKVCWLDFLVIFHAQKLPIIHHLRFPVSIYFKWSNNLSIPAKHCNETIYGNFQFFTISSSTPNSSPIALENFFFWLIQSTQHNFHKNKNICFLFLLFIVVAVYIVINCYTFKDKYSQNIELATWHWQQNCVCKLGSDWPKKGPLCH